MILLINWEDDARSSQFCFFFLRSDSLNLHRHMMLQSCNKVVMILTWTMTWSRWESFSPTARHGKWTKIRRLLDKDKFNKLQYLYLRGNMYGKKIYLNEMYNHESICFHSNHFRFLLVAFCRRYSARPSRPILAHTDVRSHSDTLPLSSRLWVDLDLAYELHRFPESHPEDREARLSTNCSCWLKIKITKK